MKKKWTKFLVGLFFLGALAWVMAGSYDASAFPWIHRHLLEIRQFYLSNRFLTLFVFCMAHLISSTLIVPAGCTTLNVLSGAVFGFWQGCLVVYPITMLSALMVFFLGRKFQRASWIEKYQNKMRALAGRLDRNDFSLMV